MEGFTAPSFSLGIDLDFDSDSQAAPIEESVPKSAAESSINVTFHAFDDDRDFDPETLTLDPNFLREEEDLPPVLKRLKRGSVVSSSVRGSLREPVKLPIVIDEIEELSSQEDRGRDEYSTTQNHSACSSSKFSIRNHGILPTQPLSKLKTQKSTLASNAPTSAHLEAERYKGVLPKLTVSPLRKFQLIDSDYDDPSDCEALFNVVKKVDTCTKDCLHSPSQSISGSEQTADISSKLLQKHLWEDFHSKENKHLATPAFDEFCEEYFGARQDIHIDQSKRGDISFNNAKTLGPDYFMDGREGCFQRNSIQANVAHCGNLPNPLPPAYCYFYHQDPRIQKLVRDRLPNFSPIGSVNHRGNQQSETTDIDYMSQFGHRDTPTRIHGTGGNGLERSSKKSKKNLSNANAKEVSQASGSWVNPRSSATIPKDASKRRVRVDSNGTGHWYTGEDGRKVYVTKNGLEMTGRTAYRHYKKENGGIFRRNRKKAAVKKPAAKKKSKR